jgi:hypothetical protein
VREREREKFIGLPKQARLNSNEEEVVVEEGRGVRDREREEKLSLSLTHLKSAIGEREKER